MYLSYSKCSKLGEHEQLERNHLQLGGVCKKVSLGFQAKVKSFFFLEEMTTVFIFKVFCKSIANPHSSSKGVAMMIRGRFLQHICS